MPPHKRQTFASFMRGTDRVGDEVRTAGGRVLAVTGLGEDLGQAAIAAYGGGGKDPLAGHALSPGHRI